MIMPPFLFRSDPVNCAFCNESLDHLTEDERQTHYEVHFSEGDGAGTTNDASMDMKAGGITPKKPNSGSAAKSNPKDVFWIPSHGTTPPDNFTPGKSFH